MTRVVKGSLAINTSKLEDFLQLTIGNLVIVSLEY
jgi:hypothetical protein